MTDPNFVCDACGKPLDDDYHDGHLPDCQNFGQHSIGYAAAPCDCDVQYHAACCPECKEAAFVTRLDVLTDRFERAATDLLIAKKWGSFAKQKAACDAARQALVDFILTGRRTK